MNRGAGCLHKRGSNLIAGRPELAGWLNKSLPLLSAHRLAALTRADRAPLKLLAGQATGGSG